MTVGVLALQGCITPHLEIFRRLNIPAIRVTSPEHLKQIDRIILPGGESTTMLKLLENTGLTGPLTEFAKTNPVWGVCAGSILMAKTVTNPDQKSLRLMDIEAERNSYGSQLNSFKSKISPSCINGDIEADFIRAPRLKSLDPSVKVLATEGNDAVLLQQGKRLASSFHVELGNDPRLHEFFLSL